MQRVLPLDYSSFDSHWYSWELLPLLPASRLLSQMALLQTWLMLLPSVLYFIIIVIVVVIIININISISRHGGFPKSGSPTDNFPSGSGNLTSFSQASQTRELENVAYAPSAAITTTFAPNTYSQISAYIHMYIFTFTFIFTFTIIVATFKVWTNFLVPASSIYFQRLPRKKSWPSSHTNLGQHWNCALNC